MKKLLTSFINAGAAQPIKQGTLDHLQEAHQETTEWINKAFTFERGTLPTSYYRVFGVYTTETAGTWYIGAGAIFQGDIMYECDAAIVTPGMGQVVIGTITTTYVTATNADPVEFSDGSTNNVHQVKKIVWSAGTSGTGSLDLTNLRAFNDFLNLSYSNTFLTASSGDWDVATAGDFSVKVNELGHRLIIDFNITSGTLTMDTSNVRLHLNYPTAIQFAQDYHGVCEYINPSNTTVRGIASVNAAAGGTIIYFEPMIDATFKANAGGFIIRGQIIAEWGDSI